MLGWAHLGLCKQLKVGWAALFILICSYVGTGWLLTPLGWPPLRQPGRFCSVPDELSSRKLALVSSRRARATQKCASTFASLYLGHICSHPVGQSKSSGRVQRGEWLYTIRAKQCGHREGWSMGDFYFFLTVNYCTNIFECYLIILWNKFLKVELLGKR